MKKKNIYTYQWKFQQGRLKTDKRNRGIISGRCGREFGHEKGRRVCYGLLKKRGQGVVWNPWEEGVGCGVDSLGRGVRCSGDSLGRGVGCSGDSFGRGGRVWWRFLEKWG